MYCRRSVEYSRGGLIAPHPADCSSMSPCRRLQGGLVVERDCKALRGEAETGPRKWDSQCQSRLCLPRKSLEGGCPKSIPPQGSGFQKWRSPLDAFLNEFTPSNTLAWYAEPWTLKIHSKACQDTLLTFENLCLEEEMTFGDPLEDCGVALFWPGIVARS